MTPYSVVYAPEAGAQLEELFNYVAERRSPALAGRFIDAVVATCEGLAMFPLRGVSREDVRPGLRVTHHKARTVIAYIADVGARKVTILGVLYGGRNLEAAMSIERND